VDNEVTSIAYNGKALSYSGNGADWTAPKSFTFDEVEGVELTIVGHNDDPAGTGCSTGGLLVSCTATTPNSPW
jgi:malic enzyme